MTFDQKNLTKEFEARERTYVRLKEEALFILEEAVRTAHIKYQSLPARVKKLDSFLAKVERREFDKPFEEMTDIVGLRVVCLFLSDIPKTADVIRKHFDVISEDNKLEDQLSSFGYLSAHFIAKMKKEYVGPRYDSLAGLAFEIQVRTIAMDAWANVSHYLDYKNEVDIPKQLKRDFYALSGLFYVADSHFEMFFKTREASKTEIEHAFETHTATLDQEINLDSLAAYLKARLKGRRASGEKELSELLLELNEAGYTQIRQLDGLLNSAWDAFVLYEKEHPPVDSTDHSKKIRFAWVGVVRVMLSISNDEYRQRRWPNARYEKYTAMIRGKATHI